MQDRYVGDIGDFAKYGLLRALCEGRQLGVAWYLRLDETHNDHSMQIGYLCRPEVWRHLDPELFDALEDIINQWQTGVRERTVDEIRERNLLPGAVFAGEFLYTDLRRPNWRQPGVWEANRLAELKHAWRADWFEDVMAQLDGCDIVYADPDNGLCPDERYNAANQNHWKRLPHTKRNGFTRAGQLSCTTTIPGSVAGIALKSGIGKINCRPALTPTIGGVPATALSLSSILTGRLSIGWNGLRKCGICTAN